MSLQLVAQHMASRGRGPDTQLVHMAPQEVAGLQALARAHGGSLTINPDTGLAEAGFLSKLLPTLIGAGLSFIPGVGPLMAAGITGAGYGVATGNLSKGLMAGLGAYGGAGLAGSLAGAGTTAGLGAASAEAALAGNTAGDLALKEALAAQPAVEAAKLEAAKLATANVPANIATNPTLANYGLTPTNLPATVAPAVPITTATAMPTPLQMSGGFGDVSAQRMLEAGFNPEQIQKSAREFASNQAGSAASPFSAKTQEMMANPLKSGFGKLVDDPKSFMTKDNLKFLGAAGLPLLMQEEEARKEREKDKGYEYSYDPGRVDNPADVGSGERRYFNPRFTRTAASGGIMDLGPLQAMSDRNNAQSMMANGGQGYANGGTTDPYNFMSGDSANAFKYLMGQQNTSRVTPGITSPLTTPMPEIGEYEYTFDPVTGTFTQKKQVKPNVPFVNTLPINNQGGGGGGGGGDRGPQGDGYSPMSSPLSQSFNGSLGYNLAEGYSTALGGLLPGATIAGMIAQGMSPGQIAAASEKAAQAQQDAVAGYVLGTMFGAPPSSAATFGGAGYGTPVSGGGYGVTSQTGAGTAANPMSVDPATAQGQQANPNSFGISVSDNNDSVGRSDPSGTSPSDGGGDGEARGGLNLHGKYYPPKYAQGGLMAARYASGGLGSLGDYSDGGRLLRGPGDGVSDSIPASIADKRPARLADGEFVVPARIVSELGNGSTEAGARQLYAMMARIQNARKKSIGKDRVAVNSRSAKMLPA